MGSAGTPIPHTADSFLGEVEDQLKQELAAARAEAPGVSVPEFTLTEFAPAAEAQPVTASFEGDPLLSQGAAIVAAQQAHGHRGGSIGGSMKERKERAERKGKRKGLGARPAPDPIWMLRRFLKVLFSKYVEIRL